MDWTALQPHLSAALTKACIRVDVVVVNTCRRTLSITWHYIDLWTLTWPVSQLAAKLQADYNRNILKWTHRSVTTAVVLSNGHPYGHFLTWLPVFFTCSMKVNEWSVTFCVTVLSHSVNNFCSHYVRIRFSFLCLLIDFFMLKWRLNNWIAYRQFKWRKLIDNSALLNTAGMPL